MERNDLIEETIKYLDKMCESSGEVLSEYHWREAAALHKEWCDQSGKSIEDRIKEKMVSIDFGKSENLELTQTGDKLKIKIKALGETTMPAEDFFDGVDNLKEQ